MLELILIVSIFSFLQSVFGVGLLLFGTPTLLLMDFQYTEVLWILLPCSLIISLIQTVTHLGVVQAKKKVAYLTLPAMSVSLFLIVTFSHNINITKIGSPKGLHEKTKIHTEIEIYITQDQTSILDTFLDDASTYYVDNTFIVSIDSNQLTINNKASSDNAGTNLTMESRKLEINLFTTFLQSI